MASEAPWEEAHARPGVPREHYAEVLAALAGQDLGALCERVAARLARGGVSFGRGEPFLVDPVPRVLTRSEWTALAAGVAQRVRALEALVHDAYGDREMVAAGLVPEATLDGAEGYEPELRGRLPDHPAIGVAGLDVVRDPAGAFLVLEDNLRTPSGYGYAAAARAALDPEALPRERREAFVRPTLSALGAALRGAAAPGVEEPRTVVLTDGRENSAYYEHADAARRLGVPLVTLGDLEVRGGAVRRRDAHGRAERVDVVYRRTDEDRLRDARGALTPVAAVLLEPWLTGRVALVNAFGTGVADDKVVHAHVEDSVRFYLGEEPLLASVHTYDLGEPGVLEEALARLDELVVKPRGGHGGHGVVIGPHAARADVVQAAETLRREPECWVVQPTIALSRHPTVVEGSELAPRHVDLRPFAFATPRGVVVPPGGLTRVAFGADALVVNSSQQGGGKDTWVLR